MKKHKYEFIELTIEYQALCFGEFTLKSGRKSPYFFNMGVFASGRKLEKLGEAYAKTIQAQNLAYDMLFGPAYKGIPLVVCTAIALNQLYQQDIPYAFNRKEPKAHGEGGDIIGTALQGNVLIIDDVVTAGTAIRHAIELINSYQAKPAGIIVALNRQERGQTQNSSITEIEKNYAIPVYSIIKLDDIIDYLKQTRIPKSSLIAMENYRQEFGV